MDLKVPSASAAAGGGSGGDVSLGGGRPLFSFLFHRPRLLSLIAVSVSSPGNLLEKRAFFAAKSPLLAVGDEKHTHKIFLGRFFFPSSFVFPRHFRRRRGLGVGSSADCAGGGGSRAREAGPSSLLLDPSSLEPDGTSGNNGPPPKLGAGELRRRWGAAHDC